MISLFWCACAFGEMHAIESVLPTFFGIPWHLGGLRYATPFTVAESTTDSKDHNFCQYGSRALQQEARPLTSKRPGFSQPKGG